ncbi:MAG: hypothetical protein KJN98_03840 [Pontiella sp.]|nr:hypothetical protein [Pontiella sp.]
MPGRFFLIAGWLFPLVLALLFIVKGRYYNPDFFVPPASAISALPFPATVGDWVLEGGESRPGDSMFEVINGKADYYLQYGAVELCSGEWVANGQRWDMYLYRFEQELGARGAYGGERPADGKAIDGVEGYTVPGQAAIAVGPYYLQLNAQTAAADTAPAVELALTLAPSLGDSAAATDDVEVDLAALAADAAMADSEGFLPESAFGFSAFNNVRTIRVGLGGAEAVWFTAPGDAAAVVAYAEELALYGGEELFSRDGVSGGSMFGSWGTAGILNGAVWGVQEAPSREALQQHWKALQAGLEKVSEAP